MRRFSDRSRTSSPCLDVWFPSAEDEKEVDTRDLENNYLLHVRLRIECTG
jgi:hypothetical protein